MGAVGENVDALTLFHSGAEATGNAQPQPDESLGSFRASTRAKNLGHIRNGVMSGIEIKFVSGSNGPGNGTLSAASVNSLKWTPPGGVQGDAVTIANGESKVLTGGSGHADKYVIVRRKDATDLAGTELVQLLDVYGNIIGGRNFSGAEATAGEALRRAGYFYNQGAQNATSLTIGLQQLATQTTSTNGLSGSGAGTLNGSDFSDWDEWGLVEIITSGGTQREIAYYSARTDTALTIPSAGRGQLGTSAAAGSAGDTLRQVPFVRWATETPTSGEITDGAETTEPSLTWYAGTVAVDVGTVNAAAALGIHLVREVLSGQPYSPQSRIVLQYAFTYDGSTHNSTARGLYAVANEGVARSEIFIDTTGDPDFLSQIIAGTVTADDTWTEDPHTTPELLSVDTEHYVYRGYRNQYGLLMVQSEPTRYFIGATLADRAEVPPLAPHTIQVRAYGVGEVLIEAQYFPSRESADSTIRAARRADEWHIYKTTDGSTPDPATDTPVVVAMSAPDVPQVLNWASTDGPALEGTPIKVLVLTARSGDGVESTNTTVYEVGAETLGPAKLAGQLTQGSAWGFDTGDGFTEETVYIDVPNNIRWISKRGRTELWADTVLIWVLWLDTAPNGRCELATTFNLALADVSGAGTGSVEVGTWDGSTKELFFNVDGVRRMRVEVLSKEIQLNSADMALAVIETLATDPVGARFDALCFQVFDPTAEAFATAMSVDTDGILRNGKLSWGIYATEAECL